MVIGLLLCTHAHCGGFSDARTRLEKDLPDIISSAAARANNSVSVAIDHPLFKITLADGVVNYETKLRAQPSDVYAMGSITKTITGALVMKYISQGKLKLDDPAHLYVDQMFSRERYSFPTMQRLFSKDRWGSAAGSSFNASDITIRDLLNMKSGVPDYDTDAYRSLQWSLPQVDFSPLQIFDFVQGPLQFQPSQPTPGAFTYCSVNFMLLGYVAAYFQNASSWTELNQREILPSWLRESDEIKFAVKGACSKYTNVHGYDTRSSVAMAQGSEVDWTSASCVAGWTAGNVLMSAAAAANWTAALYRPGGGVLPAATTKAMYPTGGEFYGLATFNLTGFNGMTGSRGVAWGHLGDTYGYTSIAAYFPKMDFAVAALTNQEGGDQDSVLELICVVYNMAQDALDGVAYRSCKFVSGDYYRGYCKCK